MKLLNYLAFLLISFSALADGISVTPQYTQPSTGTGNVVLQTSPTITTPVISSITNTGTLTLPTSTDTLVGRATTDTLTNKLYGYKFESNITAAGVNQGGATSLGSTQNFHVVTAATANQGVILPALTGTTGFIEIVRNGTGVTIKLYPDSGSTISGAGSNNPISISAGQIIGLIVSGANTWTPYNLSDFPGTGITMSASNGINTVAVDNTVVPELSTANTFTNTNTFGSGLLVATSPSFTTPAIGAATGTSLTMTNNQNAQSASSYINATTGTHASSDIRLFANSGSTVQGDVGVASSSYTDISQLSGRMYLIDGGASSTGIAIMAQSSGSADIKMYAGGTNLKATINSDGLTVSGKLAFSASNPVISACGTSPSVDANSSNNSGTVTVGTVSAASCTITFASAFSTYNHCRVASQSSVAAFAYSYTLSAITVTATSMVSDKLDYACDGV